MSIFSLIVARKGSKGLPNKVVRKINGKYVFQYSVEYSCSLSDIIKEEVVTAVSSDCEEIKEYCAGQNVVFIDRQAHLASDQVKIEEVIYDAYSKGGNRCEYVSLLYGNIPTRYPEEFKRAFDFLEAHTDYDAALSMQNVEKYNPAWMFALHEELLPEKDLRGYRRQDLEQFMIHDGHTILFRAGYFVRFMESRRAARKMYEQFGEKIKPVLCNRLIIDVDTERDLIAAEAILKYNNGGV
ncbi:MAG: hypothetical protein JXD21_02365 [Candidatus Omnitrophica bacterium]|nr:hypothetical protein [Candidatus Omnitrophota bacterium]